MDVLRQLESFGHYFNLMSYNYLYYFFGNDKNWLLPYTPKLIPLTIYFSLTVYPTKIAYIPYVYMYLSCIKNKNNP